MRSKPQNLGEGFMKKFKTISFIITVLVAGILIVGCEGKTGLEEAEQVEPGVAADTTPPRFDGIVSATVEGDNFIKLFWTAAEDDVTDAAEIIYLVYAVNNVADFRPNQTLTTTAGSLTKIIDIDESGLERGATYNFRVNAQDKAGNVDANDKYIAVQIPATVTPPVIPTTVPGFSDFELSYTISPEGNFAALNWEKEDGVKYYIYKSSNDDPIDYQTELTSLEGNMYEDNNIVINSKYNYGMIAERIASGLKTDPPIEKSIQTIDAPPTAPGGLKIYPVSPTAFAIEWKNSTDDHDTLAQLKYFVNISTQGMSGPWIPVILKMGEENVTQYKVVYDSVQPNTALFFNVQARDSNNQLSGFSDVAMSKTPKLMRTLVIGNKNENLGQSSILNLHLSADQNLAGVEGLEQVVHGVEDLVIAADEAKVFELNTNKMLLGFTIPFEPISEYLVYSMPETQCTSAQLIKDPYGENMYAMCHQRIAKILYPWDQGSVTPFSSTQGDNGYKRMALRSTGLDLYIISKNKKLYHINTDTQNKEEYDLDSVPAQIFMSTYYPQYIFVLDDSGQFYNIEIESTGKIVTTTGQKPKTMKLEISGDNNFVMPGEAYVAVSPLKLFGNLPILMVAGGNTIYPFGLEQKGLVALKPIEQPDIVITSITPDFSGIYWYIGYKAMNGAGRACILPVDYNYTSREFSVRPTMYCGNEKDTFTSLDISSSP